MTTPQRLGQIICDASYDPNLFIAGFAGACVVETPESSIPNSGLNAFYQGSKAEVLNSNIAELLAIQAGAKELYQLISRSNLTLSDVVIYTDSRTAKNNIAHFIQTGSCDQRYQYHVEQALNAIKKIVPLERLSILKVKAHVREDRANLIESFHNIMDKNANAARWLMNQHLFSPAAPKEDQKQYLSILASAHYAPEEAETLFQVGYAAVKQADKIRLLFNTPTKGDTTEHPLIKGMTAAAMEKGTTLDQVLADLQNGGSLIAMPLCKGADRTLLRHHMYHTNANVLSSRVGHLMEKHKANIAGLDVSKEALLAVPNVQIKIPLDAAERLYRQLDLHHGLDPYNKRWVQGGLSLCQKLREQQNKYLLATAGQCGRMAFLQEQCLDTPAVAFPKILQDEFSNAYFDWSTVPVTAIPDPMLGYLYQKMRNQFKVEPQSYRDPLQSIMHYANFSQDDLAYAGSVSKLLYGPESYSRYNRENLTGRQEPASQRLLNLCDHDDSGRKDAAYWCDMLSSYVSIPTIKGVSLAYAVMLNAPLPHPVAMSKTAKKVYQHLVDYQGVLENGQLRRGLHQLLIQRGAANSRALESCITEFCSDRLLNSVVTDTEKLAFANTFTRQVYRATEAHALHAAAEHFDGSPIEVQANRQPKPRPSRA